MSWVIASVGWLLALRPEIKNLWKKWRQPKPRISFIDLDEDD
jgi:hypothetical protein